MTEWFKQISNWENEPSWASRPPPKVYQDFTGCFTVRDIEVFYDGYEREWGYDIHGNYCADRIFEARLHFEYHKKPMVLIGIGGSLEELIERSKHLVEIYMEREDEQELKR